MDSNAHPVTGQSSANPDASARVARTDSRENADMTMLEVWDATRSDATARIRAAVTAYARLKTEAAWSHSAAKLAHTWERATEHAAGDPARLDGLFQVADDLIMSFFTYEDCRALLARLGPEPRARRRQAQAPADGPRGVGDEHHERHTP